MTRTQTFKATVANLFKRRPSRGFTVEEAFNELGYECDSYPSLRGRVYDLTNEGVLERTGKYRATAAGRPAAVFRRSP